MRVAVVGHIEWVTFLRVRRYPGPGEIVHADQVWEEPAGGGGVAAVELARLAGACTFYTALGNDEAGRQARTILAAHGVAVRGSVRPAPQRRATTILAPSGERSIIVHGPSLAPVGADPLGFADLAGVDAVYFCKGDAAALRFARQARVLVATARILPVLREAGIELDVLVHSAHDASERYAPGELEPPPRLVACTAGAAGGSYRTAAGEEGRWAAAPLPGPLRDSYGAGDCFAAALGYALADGLPLPEATAFAARRGALALCRPGAHGALRHG